MVGLRKKVIVVGLGNVLMGDEGVGVRAAEALSRLHLPPTITVYPAGTPSLALLHLIEGSEKVVLIDAVKLGGKPGTVYRFNFDPLLFKDESPLSMHGLDAVAALRLAVNTGMAPREIVVIGVEPKQTRLGEALSNEVEASIPKVLDLVLKEVVEHGQPSTSS
ncbi:MAG: hydrogenase maturation protease [Candidatus Nezhaarchaeota archaeon]|nr:hydrogenase maturation protease [Candidatus Nezhaarchaeota archaeon]